jgi:hypothetical protein
MDATDAVINYCIYKNIEQRGVLKYGYFKRLIGFILNSTNDNFCRKIFLDLVASKHFLKIKNVKTSYKYKFNTTPEIPYIEPDIDPARFIISWD